MGVGGVGGNPGKGEQGVFADGWDGRISCTGELLRSGRIPNGGGVLEKDGANCEETWGSGVPLIYLRYV